MVNKKILTSTIRASLYPVPVTLVTCEYKQRDNIITIAWTGILCSKPPIIYVSIRPERFSYTLVKKSQKFVVNIPSEKLLPIADSCGNVSGRDVDKFRLFNLTRITLVDGYPSCIKECKHHLLCDVIDVLELGTHHAFIGRVQYEYIDAECYKEDRIEYHKIKPIGYCRKDYIQLSSKIGYYGGFSKQLE